MNVSKVHVVFSNHLDVGFAPSPGLADNVVNRYFETYFPRAINLANEMRDETDDRYIWTTQSW